MLADRANSHCESLDSFSYFIGYFHCVSVFFVFLVFYAIFPHLTLNALYLILVSWVKITSALKLFVLLPDTII